MSYEADIWTRSARRQWWKLPAEAQSRINTALDAFAANAAGDVKKMMGADGARLRVGDYRIVFTETESAIEIRPVGHRKNIYR